MARARTGCAAREYERLSSIRLLVRAVGAPRINACGWELAQRPGQSRCAPAWEANRRGSSVQNQVECAERHLLFKTALSAERPLLTTWMEYIYTHTTTFQLELQAVKKNSNSSWHACSYLHLSRFVWSPYSSRPPGYMPTCILLYSLHFACMDLRPV
jgi:hypothetical protein